jgi:CubicO group peptidase (beta-lactamase class C family)
MRDIPIGGHADEKFAGVRDAFIANIASGADVGASVAITVDGETVVDLWGGWTDETRTKPWQRDTIVNVYSTTKTMTALTALLLADRGLLDLDAPVARYWPEFAAAGKAKTKVSHLLAHAAGLAGWRAPMTTADLFDWEKATSLLAAQEPYWEAGTASGYHSLTQGYLIGEVVRRITGKSLGTVFHEEIAAPLGADFHIGFGPEHDDRVTDLIPPTGAWEGATETPSEVMLTVITNPPLDPLETRSRGWRAAEIPAAGGHGNARAIAVIHALLANGGVSGGKRLLTEAGSRKALEPQVSGVDLVLGMPVTFTLGFGQGFGLAGEMKEVTRPGGIFWGGYGGSLALIDTERRTSFGYAMNKMGMSTVGDARTTALAKAMFAGTGG